MNTVNTNVLRNKRQISHGIYVRTRSGYTNYLPFGGIPSSPSGFAGLFFGRP